MMDRVHIYGWISGAVVLCLMLASFHMEDAAQDDDRQPWPHHSRTQYMTYFYTDDPEFAQFRDGHNYLYSLCENSSGWLNFTYMVGRYSDWNYSVYGTFGVESMGTAVIDNLTYEMVARGQDGRRQVDITCRNQTFNEEIIIGFDTAGEEWYNISIHLSDLFWGNASIYTTARITFRASLSDEHAACLYFLKSSSVVDFIDEGGIDELIDITVIKTW